MEKDFPLSLLKEKTFVPIELAPKGLDSLSRDVVSPKRLMLSAVVGERRQANISEGDTTSPAPNANGVELTQ
jgi:hypothetical protein